MLDVASTRLTIGAHNVRVIVAWIACGKKWGKGCKGCHDDHIPPWIKESASTGFHVVAAASHGFQNMEDLVDTLDDVKKTTTEIVAQLPSTTDALGQTIYKAPLPRTPASWPDFDKKEDEDEEVWDRL